MKKILEYINANKKVLIIIILIAVLILAAVIINNKSNTTEQTATTTSQTTTEKKLSEILSSISGVGKSQVLINEGESGIEGVVIVCEGANNIMARNDILNAVSTALNIQKNIIAIYAMN